MNLRRMPSIIKLAAMTQVAFSEALHAHDGGDKHYSFAIALSSLSLSFLAIFAISGTFSGNQEGSMAKAKSPLAKHRARMERQGLVRVEVRVRKEDASLVRHVASALSDPSRQAEARKLLRQRFVEPPKVSLKALLASAPLDGIDLDRSPAPGREVDL